MSLPAGVERVTVTSGQPLTLPDGTLVQGRLIFSGPDVVTIAGQDVILGGAVEVPLVDGQFSVTLCASDATGMSPTGWTYRVAAVLANAPNWVRHITLSKATPNVVLADVVVPDPVAGEFASLVDLAAGGTIGGSLAIDQFGAPAGYPIGPTGAVGGLHVLSSYAGGDDNGVGTDSTGRINLYSYQRANSRSFGENIRNFAMRSDAKTMQAFYIPVQSATKKGGYDPLTRDPMTSGVGWKPVVWQGAHYEANDHASVHGHWELEIADLSGALQGRLEIPFIDQATDATKPLDQVPIGVAYTNIRTNLADFSVRAQNMTAGPYSGQNTALRVGGNNSVNKDIALSISSDMGTAGRRWILRANTTTESSTATGTDLQILRYDNAGGQIGTALGIERATGNITLGASPGGQSSRLTAVWGTSGQHGYSAIPSATPGAGAAYDAQMTATTDRAFQAALPADANRRWVVFTDGRTEWGDGTASRDTNLYRSNPAVLKTDGALQATTSIRLNTTSLGSGVGVLAMANATTAPAGTPSGGGIVYIEAGALKYKGSSGTVTVLAPA
ncbi:hypothetical protein AB0N92_04285 [Streptomyces sp. NPDC093248]|uniref:hypothetical protein n=1 Tax=Streptomyces sp. NPDC093248 TaxID=3155072 RepID=UPI003431F795